MKKSIKMLIKQLNRTSTWFWMLAIGLFMKWFYTGELIPLLIASTTGCTSVILSKIEQLGKGRKDE